MRESGVERSAAKEEGDQAIYNKDGSEATATNKGPVSETMKGRESLREARKTV